MIVAKWVILPSVVLRATLTALAFLVQGGRAPCKAARIVEPIARPQTRELGSGEEQHPYVGSDSEDARRL
jgi:hypothetical protein